MGEDHMITEVGAMNMFFVLEDENDPNKVIIEKFEKKKKTDFVCEM